MAGSTPASLSAEGPAPVGAAPSRPAQPISARPATTPGNPQGEKLRVDSQNWLSIGLSSTKSRVPFCTWLTILLRLGWSTQLVKPSSSV